MDSVIHMLESEDCRAVVPQLAATRLAHHKPAALFITRLSSSAVTIDVRTAGESAAEHLHGAINININSSPFSDHDRRAPAPEERNIDVTHIKIHIDANAKLAAAFNIQAVPTTVLMKDGMLLGRIPGAMGATQLAQLLDQAR